MEKGEEDFPCEYSVIFVRSSCSLTNRLQLRQVGGSKTLAKFELCVSPHWDPCCEYDFLKIDKSIYENRRLVYRCVVCAILFFYEIHTLN